MKRADESHTPPRRRALLAAIAGVLGVVLTLGFLELGASLYLWAKNGRLVLPATRFLDERNAYVEAVATETCSYGDSILVHPYLAHVQTARGPCGAKYANSKSLIGKEYPDRTPAGTGVILVTGGSVAAQFTWDNREKPSPLEEILEEQFAGGAYEHFVVLNGGHGAWKQPQQYVLFGLYADVLAGVITLDGFNEHYMIGGHGRFELPSNNFLDVVGRFDSRSRSARRAELALELEAGLYRRASSSPFFRTSSLGFVVLDRLRHGLRKYASRTGRAGRPDEDWVRSSYQDMFAMHTPMERERMLALRQEQGIPVYSLQDAFQGIDETVYTDHIHVNERGNRRMAEAVADLIEREWGWSRHRGKGHELE